MSTNRNQFEPDQEKRTKKYFVTYPVPGGHAWFGVHAYEATIEGVPQVNWLVADFYKDAPEAEEQAQAYCDLLNCGA